MELTTSWKEEGRTEGLAEGLEKARRRTARLVLDLLHRRVGTISEAVGARLEVLPIERLEQLTGDLMDFTLPADVERWLERY